MLTDASIMFGAFGFNHGQRFSMVAPQDVVEVAKPLIVRHSRDFKLTISCLIQWPASFLQQKINEVIAGLRFRIVMGIRFRTDRFPSRSHFGPQLLQFLVRPRIASTCCRETRFPVMTKRSSVTI